MASFCEECGGQLEEREAFGKPRGVCVTCGHVHFEDPKVAVGVVASMDGGILLGKRAHDPKLGAWSFPSGFVDAGELVESAAVREVLEETGVEVRLDRLLGVFSTAGERVIFVAYAGTVVGGRLEAGEECLEVGVFAPDALPDLAFPHDGEIVAAWLSGEGAPLQAADMP
jgi:ADP-ribose pyrophosphatase YjhB (NUDIX family)